jgi:Tol biopolymer transport system component
LGTAAYMSPEQIRGEKLDARTDLFSFGLVLYEMATGKPAFAGDTIAAVHEGILRRAAKPVRESDPEVPPKLDEIISKALEKGRGFRYQTARDLRTDLKRLKRETDGERGTAVQAAAQGASPDLQVSGEREIVLDAARNRRYAADQPTPLHQRWGLALSVAALIFIGGLAFALRPALPSPRITGITQVTKDGRDKEPMVTDGSRIFFSSFSGGNSALYEVSAAGGETIPIQASILSPVVLDISPDRSQLLIGSFPETLEECLPWILPVVGGSPRRIGNIRATGFVSAAWSPDGKQVAYAEGNGLYRANIDGTESKEIVSIPTGATPYWPRWSPDGRRLRFSLSQSNGTSLWEVTAHGTNLHELFTGWNRPPSECCGSWTPDGRYFLFQSGRGGSANIWAIRESGSFFRRVSHQPVQLTTGPAPTYGALPSIDGKRVFVVTAQIRGELVRYDLASHQSAPYLAGISATCVNFSRDGKWVTYIAYPEGTLWRSKVDGTQRLQLTFPPLFVLQPRWSPDGTRIAFMAHEPGKHWSVYVISAEGGGAGQPVHEGADPNWSPDGKSLLFGPHPTNEAPGAPGFDLKILDLQTRAISKVRGSQGMWSPRWSPDGRYVLAFPRAADRLMLFDVRKEEWSELAKIGTGWPEWSREGDYIYFLGTPPASRHSSLFRVRISDRKLEQVASLKDVHQAPGFGIWVGFGPDDSLLLVRDAGTEDIYALDLDAP